MNQDRLTELSRIAWDNDLRILQGVRFGATDDMHIEVLLQAMSPGFGEHWLDIGCGFGEVPRLMKAKRPDLQFTLVNNNALQLDLAPGEFAKCLADMHRLKFDDESFDGAMFLFSLCHTAEKAGVLAEAARVVRPGGSLFVFDYMRRRGSDEGTSRELNSWFSSEPELELDAIVAGWKTTILHYVVDDDSHFRKLFGNDALYHELIDPLAPFFWLATKK
jgi:ubiquinone/menaquinone biosynthesis C-methylase UbiE